MNAFVTNLTTSIGIGGYYRSGLLMTMAVTDSFSRPHNYQTTSHTHNRGYVLHDGAMMTRLSNVSHIAVDAEFLKMGGSLLARSVAFVPFTTLSSPTSPHQQHTRPSVVQLDADFVANYCDLLPAGHCLRAHCALFSDGLDKYFPEYQQERRASGRHMARQFAQRVASSSTLVTEGTISTSMSNDPATDADDCGAVASTTAAASSEASPALCVDPFMVPNIAQFTSVGGLGVLHREAPTSAEFQRVARMLVSKTVVYGNSKLMTPSLGLLVKRDGVRLHNYLRHRFATEAAWLEWLESARGLSRTALGDVARAVQLPLAQPVAEGLVPGVEPSGAQVMDCATLAAFSRSLRDQWSHYMIPPPHQQGGGAVGPPSKFYAYGSADVSVLRSSVHLACSELKGLQPGGSTPPLQSLGGLRSPMQLVLTDVTKSSVFKAMGFELEMGLTPRLSDALSKIRSRSVVAQHLLATADEHNPLWDAAALAALCQVVLQR